MRTALHHRPAAHRPLCKRTEDNDGGIHARGIADGDNKLLPKHRKGKDKHVPLAVETDAVPFPHAAHTAHVHGSRRCVVVDAYLRHHSGDSGCGDDVYIHEEIQETT